MEPQPLIAVADVEAHDHPHVNPNARHRECWLRDPDGYVVVLAGTEGDI